MALFTPQNAREMAARSNAAIAARKQAMRDAVEIAVSSPAIDFAQRTLARVRLQMDRLSDEIDKEITGESKRLKELTDAYARLAEQEQKLAGRPNPGSRKPAPDKPAKRQLAPMPQPVVDEAARVSNPDEPNG